MDDMEMFGPPLPNPVMDEAMALDTKVDALCKLANYTDCCQNSAARMRLIEAMEQAGLVSTMDGRGGREVLVKAPAGAE